MKQYTDLLRRIRKEGRLKVNRTGVDTISLLGPQMEFDMSEGYPLLDLREIGFKHAVNENLWFLGGECNNEDLVAMGTKFWSKWALKEPYLIEQLRPVPAVVNDYIAARLKDDGLEITDDTPIADAEAMRMKYVDELAAADKRDFEAGLPTLVDVLHAKSHDELMGGFAEIRKYPEISFGDMREVLPVGALGPIYGVLWRRWMGHDGQCYDQIGNMIAKLSSDNPKLRYSRANIVTAFQPSVMPDETYAPQDNVRMGRQALAACHTFFQLFAEPLTQQERIDLLTAKMAAGEAVYTGPTETMDEHLDDQKIPRDQLSLKLYQRSADFPVGVPFNIAGYSLLLMMFCKQLNMKPAKFIHTFGDAHIYVDQVEGVDELLRRQDEAGQQIDVLPRIKIADGVPSMFEYKPEDFELVGYRPMQPQIKFPVAV